MNVRTTRFGCLPCRADQVLLFPEGVIGFEQHTLWMLVAEEPLWWLQCLQQAEVALPLASPFLFCPDYQVRVAAADCRELQPGGAETPLILNVVSRRQEGWTINLRAPLLIRPQARLGCQVITIDEQPIRYGLPRAGGTVRKSA